jgi:NAD(P)-dependent dehydrogenase (short-subunit alcohol dehydrogenase family)
MKTVLITGATDGIGRETARQLLSRGFRVLVHGRTLEKAQRVVAEFQRAQPEAAAAAVYADLARMPAVVALAEQIKKQTPVLDVLINNAGVYQPQRQLTPEGFEVTLAVNHLAPFLLTQQLLPLLHAAPAGRIITVSSIAHQSGTLVIGEWDYSRGFSGYGAYAASKLANVLFTLALARRLTGTTVTANCLHPGVIDTKLLRSGFGVGGASVAAGARTSVYLATAEAVSQVSGHYFIDCQPTSPALKAQEVERAEALWRASENALRPWLPVPSEPSAG